ncbi:hypothetical protein [Pasteurella multocida]|uniref:hypothetical protein n=1 Tax=Pasteurella multocida TaxID=747 RepID=UPI0014801EEF|nr:hypothetical protein [Pasteurella multocida]NNH97785.1 hypothetical protein [Pasteurella multocida]NNI42915.1 hypothetical protein [Pasteurella multocida]
MRIIITDGVAKIAPKRLIREYRIFYKTSKDDNSNKFTLSIDSSLFYAKRYATKWIPEQYKNLKNYIIEIYCNDFIENEPICTKYGNQWIEHPFLKSMDFWDFSN